ECPRHGCCVRPVTTASRTFVWVATSASTPSRSWPGGRPACGDHRKTGDSMCASTQSGSAALERPDPGTGGGAPMQRQTTPASRRPYGSGSLGIRIDRSGREVWYGAWRGQGRQLKRRIGFKRNGSSCDGLTRAQAEAKLRELMDTTTVIPVPRGDRLTV